MKISQENIVKKEMVGVCHNEVFPFAPDGCCISWIAEYKDPRHLPGGL
jgi:hypothetical protein